MSIELAAHLEAALGTSETGIIVPSVRLQPETAPAALTAAGIQIHASHPPLLAGAAALWSLGLSHRSYLSPTSGNFRRAEIFLPCPHDRTPEAANLLVSLIRGCTAAHTLPEAGSIIGPLPSETFHSVLLTPPLGFHSGLGRWHATDGGVDVEVLMAVPVSGAEARHCQTVGAESFLRLAVEQGLNLRDWNRREADLPAGGRP